MIVHLLGGKQVAPVDDDGKPNNAIELDKIDGGKLFPVGENEDRVGIFRSFKNCFGVLHFCGRGQDGFRAIHGGRIVSGDGCAGFGEATCG